MTYRKDSDFFTPYGSIVPKDKPLENTETIINAFVENNKDAAFMEKKKKPVAWFVSNCDTHSNRGDYVKGKNTQF